MNIISVSVTAMLLDIFVNHHGNLNRSMLKHISKLVNHRKVPDRVIVASEDMRSVIDWEVLDKMKLIRILIRCVDQDIDDGVLDKIKNSLKKYDYRIKDLSFLFMRKPEYIEQFPIDIDKITTTEAARLLSFGHKYFLKKINVSKYKFNYKESMNIIQGYDYMRSVIKKVNYKTLKSYQISEILTVTGERDLDILDISKLNNIDWLNLLAVRPEMLKHCDYDKFLRSDIFYSIKLCCMFEEPDLSYLVLERNINDISPFGWEKLLIEKPEDFLAHCNFSKLDDNNWKNILAEHPKLHVYKID